MALFLPTHPAVAVSESSLDELMGFAHELADVAGDAIRSHFRKPIEVEDKGNGRFDPVTLADREAERAMRRLIRERYKLQGRIQVLSAEGRMSAWVLLGLPFFIAVGINVMNPHYMTPLYTEPVGKMILTGCLASMAFGVLGAVRGASITIDDPSCVAVSYPTFWDDLARLRLG